MPAIFYVHCPRCGGRFPCHTELWQVDYALLCPFCQQSFHQEESPLIVSATGERRAGSRSAVSPEDRQPMPAGASPSSPGTDGQPPGPAESM